MNVVATIAGSAILQKLLPIIIKAGAPILADLVRSHVGDTAGKVVEAIAGTLGVENARERGVEANAEVIVQRYAQAPGEVEQAIRNAEYDHAEYWSMLGQADLIRADLLKAEMKEPIWTWAWRPFWMWLLAGFWVWTAIAVALGLEHIDFGTLIWLTTAYLALYMGGHTVKDAVAKFTGGGQGS